MLIVRSLDCLLTKESVKAGHDRPQSVPLSFFFLFLSKSAVRNTTSVLGKKW